MGLLLAIVLVYLILMAQFASFVDPFIILLAIPSVAAGWLIGSVVFGDYFQDSVLEAERDYHGLLEFTLHGLVSPPFWLAVAGTVTAWPSAGENEPRIRRMFASTDFIDTAMTETAAKVMHERRKLYQKEGREPGASEIAAR